VLDPATIDSLPAPATIDPLRIGLFTTSLPEEGRKPGGVDVLIDRLAGTLTQRGHDVCIWTYSPRPEGAPYKHVQLHPRSFTFNKVARATIVPWRVNAVSFASVQVLHVHGDDWFYLRRRVPTVRTLHGSALYEAKFAESIKRRVSQFLLVPLEVLSSHLATGSYGVIPDDAPLHRTRGWLPGGVEVPCALPTVRSANPSILFVGTWAGRKRGKLLFDLFNRVIKPSVPNAELWMVSDHTEAAPGVTWHHAIDSEDLVKLYRQAWAFCLPSVYEGFGLPYLEALAHGTPIVTSDNPGARFLLHDGELARVASDDDLGASLVALLQDRDRRSALAAAGYARACEFTWERIASVHERAYVDAIQRWRGGRTARARRTQSRV
jgi:glycosyltransferase involved in cell wall biosynthesis